MLNSLGRIAVSRLSLALDTKVLNLTVKSWFLSIVSISQTAKLKQSDAHSIYSGDSICAKDLLTLQLSAVMLLTLLK